MGLGMVTAAAGAVAGGISDAINAGRNRRAAREQEEAQKRLMEEAKKNQLEMWKATNYEPQIEELKKAGLNPGLIYGMSGGGATTAGSSSGNASMAGPTSNSVTGGAGMGIQLGLMQAQKENIEADTKNKLAEVPNKEATTPNIKADTENKILEGIIKKYTGKELKDTYENVTSPNRGIQAKTYEEELEARQGIAGTIYEMWKEGKLHDKATGEVEQILLQNAKTRAEKIEIMNKIDLLEQNIKGQKLENIIKELETRLQTETGIDRNSPTWFKILGRLFVQLTNK